MPTLGHGSDLTLAPTLGPWVRQSRLPIRSAITAIAAAGFGAVQLDASLPGLRPRELDDGARRDLTSTVRRAGLTISGIDLFIPREHLVAGEHIDRAADALLAAVGLAGDLGRVPLSCALPVAEIPDDVGRALVGEAAARGVMLAVHAEDQPAALDGWLAAHGGAAGLGLDPALVLAANGDPVQRAQQAANVLTVARLSDTQRGLADGSRLPAGSGSLDIAGYRISADLAPHRHGPVVLDLRGLTDPAAAAATAQRAWDDAAISL